MDMDGTTTTTEELCLHSLETMVRRITERPNVALWSGLDRARDYPFIIGNSTTRHVEYLIGAYDEEIRRAAFARALLEGAVWTILVGADRRRQIEAQATLRALGWNEVLVSREFTSWRDQGTFDPAVEKTTLDAMATRLSPILKLREFSERVRAAIEIYYYRYHEILSGIARGRGAELSRELTPGKRLIEPMPGVAVFLSLVKGWLGERASEFYDRLRDECSVPPNISAEIGRKRLSALGRLFARFPLKVAVVTSSIRYEAEIVLGEVFSVLREQIAAWPIAAELADRFSTPKSYYDAFLSADDAGEIRLKPHRDLYSSALHALGVSPEEFGTVVGFEDSESGTISLRTAGIGLCVAVPFADTAGHDLSAAAYVLPGGLPQALLTHNLFLRTN
jgi:beta-phosphoglucomutase-like phosphatase (HAD superfamily)